MLLFVKHCETDTYFQMAIAAKVQILPLTQQLTNLSGNSWYGLSPSILYFLPRFLIRRFPLYQGAHADRRPLRAKRVHLTSRVPQA